jgi:hypothetical protein
MRETVVVGFVIPGGLLIEEFENDAESRVLSA